jgi:hypothetical protein
MCTVCMPAVGPGQALLQLAVGISVGAEIAGHALQAGAESDQGSVAIQLDWHKVFNILPSE